MESGKTIKMIMKFLSLKVTIKLQLRIMGKYSIYLKRKGKLYGSKLKLVNDSKETEFIEILKNGNVLQK